MPRRTGDQGFTISELVLVLVVLAGLIFVAVASVNGIDDQAAERDCRSELRALKAASERFKAELTIYPENDQKLQDAGYLAIVDTPNWRVVTATVDGEPEYLAVGARCAGIEP